MYSDTCLQQDRCCTGLHIVSEHIYSPSMEKGRQKLENTMVDGLGRDLLNAGRFCFSCEQIFANRKCLEEHTCSSTSFICSCGTEFTEYKDMQEHSTTHEPGHQVLDHETIKKRRLEKRKAEEEQLKRLETGEVVWKSPKHENAASVSLLARASHQVTTMQRVSMQSARISQVPGLHHSLSKSSFLPNPGASNTEVKDIFANVGAPTVDLWTLYQPVVLLQTVHTFNRKRSYICGKCGQCFITKPTLIAHHSTHVTDKVSGCIGCGLLLSSKKLVPRFHVCNSPNNITKLKIITARPLRTNPAVTSTSLNPNNGKDHTTSSLELKTQNLGLVRKNSESPCVTPTLQFKNQNIKPYSQSNLGLHATPSRQVKSHHPTTFSSPLTAPSSQKPQSPNPGISCKSTSGLPIMASRELKMTGNSASGLLSKPTKTLPASNGFKCRVCHIPFETAQLLQRHKCIKAKEFMARHVRPGKPHYKPKMVTPVASPNFTQMNGERKFGVPASGNQKKPQVMAVSLNQVQGVDPMNHQMGEDTEDDCYIVETGPDKPAEMIYQVTSSVPITI